MSLMRAVVITSYYTVGCSDMAPIFPAQVPRGQLERSEFPSDPSIGRALHDTLASDCRLPTRWLSLVGLLCKKPNDITTLIDLSFVCFILLYLAVSHYISVGEPALPFQ